jgi:hypothetical protein
MAIEINSIEDAFRYLKENNVAANEYTQYLKNNTSSVSNIKIRSLSVFDFNKYITGNYNKTNQNTFNAVVSTTSKFNSTSSKSFNTTTVQNNTGSTHSEECYANGHVSDAQYLLWIYDGFYTSYIGYNGHNKTDTNKKHSTGQYTYAQSIYCFRPCFIINEVGEKYES